MASKRKQKTVTTGSVGYPRDVHGRWPVLSAGKVAEVLGAPRRRVLTYVELGLVELPDQSPGTGNNRMFSYYNMLGLATYEALYTVGFTPAKMRDLAAQVHETWEQHLGRQGPLEPVEILPGKPSVKGVSLAAIVLRPQAIEAQLFDAFRKTAPDQLATICPESEINTGFHTGTVVSLGKADPVTSSSLANSE